MRKGESDYIAVIWLVLISFMLAFEIGPNLRHQNRELTAIHQLLLQQTKNAQQVQE